MKYDWSKMSPRERDARVAEKILGCKVNPRAAEIEYDGCLCKNKDHSRSVNLGNCTVNALKNYTTDIRAAWEVVNELLQNGIKGYGANIILETRGDGSWSCCFYSPDVPQIEEYAPTAPEAICVAALRVMGVEV